MHAMLLGLLVAAGVVNDRVNPPQLQIDVLVCQGDPLGSRAEGTVKYLAEPRIVTQSGRSAMFRTGASVLDPAGDRRSAEWVGTTVDFLPIAYPNGKVWVEVNATHREARHGLSLPGEPGYAEQTLRFSKFVTAGEKIRFRIAADSPSSQTWAEVTVTPYRPEK
jgi:pilus assembly protein CpaC